MEDLDFQVNDKVYCLINGNGIVKKKYNDGDLTIHFLKTDWRLIYSKEGIRSDSIIYGNFRTLYHGHDLEVTVKEKKPERFKWVNLKFNPNTKNGTITSRNYNTKKSALENISNFIKEPWVYIDTIQLIPNHLKEIKEK